MNRRTFSHSTMWGRWFFESGIRKVGRNRRRDATRRLRCERLETRRLLFSDLIISTELTSSLWTERNDAVTRLSHEALEDSKSAVSDSNFIGPVAPVAREWILQLTSEASSRVSNLADSALLIENSLVRFEIVAGLGAKGMILVQSHDPNVEQIETALRENINVSQFARNRRLESAALVPNDGDFICAG